MYVCIFPPELSNLWVHSFKMQFANLAWFFLSKIPLNIYLFEKRAFVVVVRSASLFLIYLVTSEHFVVQWFNWWMETQFYFSLLNVRRRISHPSTIYLSSSVYLFAAKPKDDKTFLPHYNIYIWPRNNRNYFRFSPLLVYVPINAASI